MSESTARGTDKLETVATVLGSLVILLPLLLSRFVEAALDSANPANVDITQDLAYLREVLVASFGLIALLLVVIAVICVAIVRRDRSAAKLRLPLLVVGLNLAVGVGLLLVNALNDSIESGYLPS